MRIRLLTYLLIGMYSFGLAQTKDSLATKYLEDQIYVGITYNVLNKRPAGISPNGFSNGIFIGYIKDLPLNEERNFGIGIGLGYGRNTYFQNLKISEVNNSTVFEPVEGTFTRNKFSLHSIEFPFEIRWRTSTPSKYKFWRVYSGIKFGYVFGSNAKLKQERTISVINIAEVNKFQYGLTLSLGYGTWNVSAYYGLNEIFSDAFIEESNTPIVARELRVGLIFYIW
ncbi:MAG: porin family protein [Flavobacteriaceae bacterium]|nr:porin family protein [Flavobacteriaceae bacterium]